MANFRFIHAADIHLDSPLRGLDAYEGAPSKAMRSAPRDAFINLINLCLEEKVDFLILAGDLFDGDWRDMTTGLFFTREMGRLSRANIPVYIVRGNHDAESVMTKQLRLPDNVHLFSSRKDDAFEIKDLGVVMHGISYGKKAVHDDLTTKLKSATDGRFHIGVLHTSLNGRDGHANYAPCHLDSLHAKGYKYWALGHVHKREVLSEDPWVIFPGNLQGRHARELGPKGCTLVTVEDHEIVSVENRHVDVLRWAHLNVDISEATSMDDALAEVRRQVEEEYENADGRTLAIRVTVKGKSEAHTAISRAPDTFRDEIRSDSLLVSDEGIWIEQIKVRSQPLNQLDVESLKNREDALGGLLSEIDRLRKSPEALAALDQPFADLLKKLPVELREGDDSLDLESAETRKRLIDEAENLLVARLLGGPEA
ncbi:MAG: exonuclease SbcD [Planctomycetota bacterium]|jgi:exonuclease SbcD